MVQIDLHSYDPDKYPDDFESYAKFYSFQCTPKEMWFFLFKKKLCMRDDCGTKLKRFSNKEYVGLAPFSTDISQNGGPLRREYDVAVFYRCPKCGSEYSLSELAIGEIISPVSPRGRTQEEIIADDIDTIKAYNRDRNKNIKSQLISAGCFVLVVAVLKWLNILH